MNQQDNKTTLVPVIRSCSSVPNPYVLNNYRILANTDDNAKLVVLRIARLCQLCFLVGLTGFKSINAINKKL